MAADECTEVFLSTIPPTDVVTNKSTMPLPDDKSEDSNVAPSNLPVLNRANEQCGKALANLYCDVPNLASVITNLDGNFGSIAPITDVLVTKGYLRETDLTNDGLAGWLNSYTNRFPQVNLGQQLGKVLSEMQITQLIFPEQATRSLWETINIQMTQAGKVFKGLLSQLQEENLKIVNGLRNISSGFLRFDFPVMKIDPLLVDAYQAWQGDIAAVNRLVDRINWSPNQWQREAIRTRARIAGKSPEEVRRQALTQGLLQVLHVNEHDKLPVFVEPESAWARSENQLEAIYPVNLDIHLFCQWAQEEAARAAGLWLIEHPYAGAFVVSEPPSDDWNLKLVKFTSSMARDCRLDTGKGRPFGNGIFVNCQVFLNEIKLAVDKIRKDGKKVTQEGVAEVFSQKGFVGSAQPVSQLRRWTKAFGFRDWTDLITHI